VAEITQTVLELGIKSRSVRLSKHLFFLSPYGEEEKEELTIHPFWEKLLWASLMELCLDLLCGNSSFDWSRGVDKQLNTCSSLGRTTVWSLCMPLLTVPFSSYSFVPMVSAWVLFGSSDPSVDLSGRPRLVSLGFGMTTPWHGLTSPPILGNSFLENRQSPPSDKILRSSGDRPCKVSSLDFMHLFICLFVCLFFLPNHCLELPGLC